MIHPYQPDDQKDLLAVFQLNVPTYFAPQEADDYLEYLAKHGDSYFTLRVADEILGGVGIIYREKDYSGHITWIFVHPDHAGKGLGKKLVEFSIDKLKTDYQVERLQVRTSQYAHQFFERFGFQTILYRKDYWHEGIDLYSMECVLDTK